MDRIHLQRTAWQVSKHTSRSSILSLFLHKTYKITLTKENRDKVNIGLAVSMLSVTKHSQFLLYKIFTANEGNRKKESRKNLSFPITEHGKFTKNPIHVRRRQVAEAGVAYLSLCFPRLYLSHHPGNGWNVQTKQKSEKDIQREWLLCAALWRRRNILLSEAVICSWEVFAERSFQNRYELPHECKRPAGIERKQDRGERNNDTMPLAKGCLIRKACIAVCAVDEGEK